VLTIDSAKSFIFRGKAISKPYLRNCMKWAQRYMNPETTLENFISTVLACFSYEVAQPILSLSICDGLEDA